MSHDPGADAPSIQVGATVAGLDPAALIAEWGSPLYVYDADVLRARAAALRTALPEATEVAFACKANGSPLVLRTLAQAGVGVDVASGGELRAALRAGFEPARVVFTGPGKTDAELAEALDAGIGALTIESLEELDVLIALAGLAAAGQGLMLRLATEGESEGLPIISAPGNVKFGLTDAEAEEAVSRLQAARSLAPEGPYVLRGFHAFGASNVRDAAVLVQSARDLAARAEPIAARHGITVELLDMGGGLGIPYAHDEASLDITGLGAGLAAEVQTWGERPALRGARLLIEPGRWLAGPAGSYICRVTRTKERGGRVVAISDGGIHHLLRPRLVGQDHRVVPLGEAAVRAADVEVDLVGPLCTGIDMLASAVPSPRPGPGDLYAVLDAGAYGYSESMPLFLAHPTPAELVVSDGAVSISRDRIEPG